MDHDHISRIRHFRHNSLPSRCISGIANIVVSFIWIESMSGKILRSLLFSVYRAKTMNNLMSYPNGFAENWIIYELNEYNILNICNWIKDLPIPLGLY